MGDVTVKGTDRGPLEFDVEVAHGGGRTTHRVTVPADLPDQFNGVAPQALVEESFTFLLEREPATSIMREFSLSVIPRYFPEYEREMKSRLG